VSYAAITLRVASQPVFIVVSLYFVNDSVRKLLDTPSYCNKLCLNFALQNTNASKILLQFCPLNYDYLNKFYFNFALQSTITSLNFTLTLPLKMQLFH